MKKTVANVSTIGCLPFLFLWFLLAEMFEFSLNVWFGKDIPWYWDYICGLVLNGVMVFVWIVSIIASFVTQTPVFP
jgi:hypothetical protein